MDLSAQWEHPIFVADGELEGVQWVLEAYRHEDMKGVGIHHPEGRQGAQGFKGESPRSVLHAYMPSVVDMATGSRYPVVIGQVRRRAHAVRYEADGRQPLTAELYDVPGDEEWRVLLIPKLEPGEGELIATDGAGGELERRRIEDPMLVFARLREFKQTNERARGTAPDGTEWTLSAAHDLVGLRRTPGLSMYLHESKPGEHGGTGGGCGGDFLAEAPAIKFGMHANEGHDQYVFNIGQVSKDIHALRSYLDDEQSGEVHLVDTPDLPVNVFVAVAPPGQYVTHLQGLDAAGGVIATAERRRSDP